MNGDLEDFVELRAPSPEWHFDFSPQRSDGSGPGYVEILGRLPRILRTRADGASVFDKASFVSLLAESTDDDPDKIIDFMVRTGAIERFDPSPDDVESFRVNGPTLEKIHELQELDALGRFADRFRLQR